MRANDRQGTSRRTWLIRVAPRLLLTLAATLGAAGCRTANVNSIAHNRPAGGEASPLLRPRGIRRRAQPRTPSGSAAWRRSRPSRRRWARRERPRRGRLTGDSPSSARGTSSWSSRTSGRPSPTSVRTTNGSGSGSRTRKTSRSTSATTPTLRSTTLAVTYQPDWIVEAMGLKPITPDEAAQIKVRPGPGPGTDEPDLPGQRLGGPGLQPDDDRLGPHPPGERVPRLSRRRQDTCSPRRPSRNTATSPCRVIRPRTRARPIVEETCRVPENIVLEWKREQLSLDVALKDVKVNQFAAARRTAPVRRADAGGLRPGQPGRGGPAEGVRRDDGHPGEPAGPRAAQSRALESAAPDPGRRRRGEDPRARPNAPPPRGPCSCRSSAR